MRFPHPNTLTTAQIEQYRRPSNWTALTVVRLKSTAAVCYMGEYKSRFLLKIFVGKALKAAYFYGEKTALAAASVAQRLLATIEQNHQERYAAKAKQRATDLKRVIEVGAIFSASWGYDQTNVDFYQVVAVRGPFTVVVRSIAKCSASVGIDDRFGDYVAPVMDKFISEPMTKRLRNGAFSDRCRYATLWNGRPLLQTYTH